MYNRLIIFRINYDKQKPVWQGFVVRKQATLIASAGIDRSLANLRTADG